MRAPLPGPAAERSVLLRPVPVARVESGTPPVFGGAMKPRGYPAPTSGTVSVAIQGGALKFGGWYVARLHMPDGETRCCDHHHESRAGARECGWRLRTLALSRGELPAERVLWVTGTREPE